MRTKGLIMLAIGGSLMACSNNLGGSSTSATSTLQVANSAMKTDELIFRSPIDGGLVGHLYVQPRETMIAPDTQTVGCSQKGDGAKGLAEYLSQPSWITQEILLTELFVPTRDFMLGFDSIDPNGGLKTVRSFFAVDVDGYFKLDAQDTEGDYQFAIIADDSAMLRTTGVGGKVLIDNEKPSGVNITCTDKTQGAHMSCTSDWSDQSSSKIQTVHMKKTDKLMINFQYWQGPGLGISMMAFYRKVPAGGVSTTSCGQELGFDDGSVALNNLLADGWKPIRITNLGNYWNF